MTTQEFTAQSVIDTWKGAGIDAKRAWLCLERSGINKSCTLKSRQNAVLDAHHAGVDPFGSAGEAWITERKGEAILTLGYKGVLKLCRNGGVSVAEARAVFKGDLFEVEYGTEPRIIHKPAFVAGAPLTHVYARVVYAGEAQFDVMSRAEVDIIRELGSARGPWVNYYDEMAKKTVLRRLCKVLPMSSTSMDALNLDDDLGFRTERREREAQNHSGGGAAPLSTDSAGDSLAAKLMAARAES